MPSTSPAGSASLCATYDLPSPASVRWADNQLSRWGSCTPSDGTIRVSSRLAAFPRWVLDYVLVHELAHLVIFGHGPEFTAIVDRYPLADARASSWHRPHHRSPAPLDLTTDGDASIF